MTVLYLVIFLLLVSFPLSRTTNGRFEIFLVENPGQGRNTTLLRACLKKLQPVIALDEECSLGYASLASSKWGTIIELPLKTPWTVS